MNCCLANAESALTMSKLSISRNASRATSSGYRRRRFSTRNSRASSVVAVAIPGKRACCRRATSPDAFAVLLGRKWLPEEIIVLADRVFVDRLGVTYAALPSHPDLSVAGRICGRLANAAAAAKARHGRAMSPRSSFAMNASVPSSTDETIIDLTAEEDDDDECEVLEFRTAESGRTVRVRFGRPGHSLRPIRGCLTRSNAQLPARSRVAIRLSSQTMPSSRKPTQCFPCGFWRGKTRVQVYHAAVEAALSKPSGGYAHGQGSMHVIKRLRSAGSTRGRRNNRSSIGSMRPSTGLAPADKLRPHAPQHWREFRAFMEVVNIPPVLADTIWREGIEPLRIDRRQAGALMAQPFVSVLVDPHGGLGSIPCGHQGEH